MRSLIRIHTGAGGRGEGGGKCKTDVILIECHCKGIFSDDEDVCMRTQSKYDLHVHLESSLAVLDRPQQRATPVDPIRQATVSLFGVFFCLRSLLA